MFNLKNILKFKTSIIVSGSTGFIGFNFVEYVLKNSKIKVFAYREKQVLASNNFRLVKLKKYKNFYLINKKTIKNLRANVKAVFNFASYGVDSRQRNISEMVDGNIKLSLKMIEISKKFNAKYIHVSSCYEYKTSNKKITEQTPLKPKSLYGVFKAVTSSIVEHVCIASNNNFVIIYLFGVYGPYESGTKILPDIFRYLSKNKSIKLTDGKQLRDYTYISDIVKGFLILGFNRTKRNKYNLCSSKGIKIKNFINIFAKVGKFNKNLLNFGKKKMKENNFSSVIGNNRNIRGEFGWKPTVSLEEGMELTLNEFRERNVL